MRSDAWFAGDDEVAVLHRVALRNGTGTHNDAEVRPVGGPIIGIADSSSELNACNLPLRSLIPEVVRGIEAAGGTAVVLPVMSLGEDLMKPTAMLYRNLLAMEVEEYARAYPLDGLVLLGNCDKSIPGALLGAVSSELPTIVVNAGPRPEHGGVIDGTSAADGARMATGTDLWRASAEYRAGRLSGEEWRGVERALACGPGACNSMGTASSMAIVTEVLGMMLPGTATLGVADPERLRSAELAGRQIVTLVEQGRIPAAILTPAAFANAVVALCAIGGSTNVIVHLLALAARVGVPLTLADVDRIARSVPLLVDVAPSGAGLIQDFMAAGGVPTLLRELGELIDGDATSVSGESLRDVLATAALPQGVIKSRQSPVKPTATFAVLRGNLAADGAVLKLSASTPELSEHRGRAVVFDSYQDMLDRIDDPELPVQAESVLVLRGAGPVGAPGMPEWGVIPIPAKLLRVGVRDMVRISDGRISGTAFGTCVAHVSPEAAVGGVLALVRDGDEIELSVSRRSLQLLVPEEEWRVRAAEWRAPEPVHLRGWPLLYQRTVQQAHLGADLDFLAAPTSAHRRRIDPQIGLS